MRKQQLFLAYYTFFASIGLFLWALLIEPKPEGFFLTLLFIPTSLYFFGSFIGLFKIQPQITTENHHETHHTKIPLMILLTLFISACSIFIFSSIQTKDTSDTVPFQNLSKQMNTLKKEMRDENTLSNKQILKKLGNLEEQLTTVKTETKTPEKTSIMGDKTTNVGTITPKETTIPVTIYKEKSISSDIIGKAEFGKEYTYIEKDQEWYLIFGEKEGYIQSHVVKEVAY